MKTWYARRAAGTGLALALALLTLGLSGCTSPAQQICEERENCRDGNEQDVDACVTASAVTESFLDDIGCHEEYVAYTECYLDKASCETEDLGVSCASDDDCFGGRCNSSNECVIKDYQLDSDDCEAEERAFDRCYDLD